VWYADSKSGKKYQSIPSDIKRFGIARIIVGLKLEIFNFQLKRKNQKYPLVGFNNMN